MARNRGICLEFHRGVSAEVRKTLRAFAAKLPSLIPIRHTLRVIVAAPPILFNKCDWRTATFGLFDPKRKTILIAGGIAMLTGASQFDVCETLAHEFVHYEQWRDKRPLSERGVDKRAERLTREILQEQWD